MYTLQMEKPSSDHWESWLESSSIIVRALPSLECQNVPLIGVVRCYEPPAA